MYFQAQFLSLNFSQFLELLPFLALAVAFALSIVGAGFKFPANFFKILGFLGFGSAIVLWSFVILKPTEIFMGLQSNAMTRVVGILISAFGLISFAAFDTADRYEQKPEWLALTFLSALGLTLLPTAHDWASFFIFLETFSIPAYVLVAFDGGRERSLEASLKYMLSGAFASALLLMGIALAYLEGGSITYLGLASNLPQTALSSFALVLILAGILFKLTAVPFHFWAPDVYQGAPMGVAAFLAAATKIGVFSAGAIAFYESGFSARTDVMMAAVIAGCASALIGSFLAYTQRSFRRMLAYSGTVNAGVLAPLMVSGNIGLPSGLFFLFIYGATLMIVLSAFASVLRKRDIDANEDLDVESFSRTDKNRAGMECLIISTALFSMAGIPPLPGFLGKYWAFSDLWQLGHKEVVICGLIGTLLGVAYYIRIAGKFFFTESRKALTA